MYSCKSARVYLLLLLELKRIRCLTASTASGDGAATARALGHAVICWQIGRMEGKLVGRYAVTDGQSVSWGEAVSLER